MLINEEKIDAVCFKLFGFMTPIYTRQQITPMIYMYNFRIDIE